VAPSTGENVGELREKLETMTFTVNDLHMDKQTLEDELKTTKAKVGGP